MANSVGYHESEDKLKPETQDKHRALTSAMEELEAADWYDQRIDAAGDPELKEILAHNRDEEKEHFVMLLEWYRRRDAKMSGELQKRLFAAGAIVTEKDAAEASPDSASTSAADGDSSLGIGSLKGGQGL
jgi:ferritin-like protein